MNNDELTKEQANAVLQALNDAITSGHWSSSNFLRVIEKRLTEIRDEVRNEIELVYKKSLPNQSEQIAFMNKVQTDKKMVYVALYSATGKSLQSWEWIVTNLPRQMVSRPIYEQEEQAQAMIKTKENRFNEAYVSIYIEETDVLPVPEDKITHDKLGQPRLLLKDGALKIANIREFVHETGKYHYSQGRLVKDAS